MPAGSRHPDEPIDPDLELEPHASLTPHAPLEPDTATDAGQLHRRAAAPRRAEPGVLAVIAAGGMLGASARYGVSQAIHTAPHSFPWATFWTNIGGAFALGLGLILLLERHPGRRHLRAFFATGVVGAFTTMSTFQVETVTLFKDGYPAIGFAYGVGSVAAGLLAALAGIRIARMAATRPVRTDTTEAVP